MSKQSLNYLPNYIPHPGLTLAEVLENKNMTQVDLAQRTSRPEKTISEIINGKTSITPETAIQLERVLGIEASFWNNLEKNYRELKAYIDAKVELTKEVELVKKYPYNEMAQYGWIPKTRSINERVEHLLSYFGVNSLVLVDKVMDVNYRQYKSKKRVISKESVQAWLRKGEIDGRNIETKPFNPSKLNEAISQLKYYSTLEPEEFSKPLKEALSNCGVALVFTNDLPKTYISGAARWLSPEKALIQLSLRGKDNDKMWFTLYHEIAHILRHSKKEQFIDWNDNNQNGSDEEREANHFAAESLIPRKKLLRFIREGNYDVNSLRAFADNLSIHPAIVVGRLQHEGVISFSSKLNSLKDRYVIKSSK